MYSTACKVRWFSKIDKFPRHTSFHIKQGIARTQSPTNKNYAAKFPTFGEIVGVNRPAVQWNSLVLGELPPWSQLAPQPGKYACTENAPQRTSRFPMCQSPSLPSLLILLCSSFLFTNLSCCHWVLYNQRNITPRQKLSTGHSTKTLG